MSRKKNSKYTPNRYQKRFMEPVKRTNLKRTDNNDWVNKHGVTISQEERKAFERSVNAVNRKHNKMLRETDPLPRAWVERDASGKYVRKEADTVQQVRLMGRPPEMIIAKRSKNLQRFESKREFNQYMKELNRINNRTEDYIRDRIRLYKRNFTKALRESYGEAGDDIAMKIRMMKPDEYMKLVTQSDELRIEAIYPQKGEDGNDKLNQIRALLGMKEKDTYTDEYLD